MNVLKEDLKYNLSKMVVEDIKLMRLEGYSLKEIANLYNKSESTVQRFLKNNGLIFGELPIGNRKCVICGSFFEPKNINYKYCSVECADIGKKSKDYDLFYSKNMNGLFVGNENGALYLPKFKADFEKEIKIIKRYQEALNNKSVNSRYLDLSNFNSPNSKVRISHYKPKNKYIFKKKYDIPVDAINGNSIKSSIIELFVNSLNLEIKDSDSCFLDEIKFEFFTKLILYIKDKEGFVTINVIYLKNSEIANYS